jgi:cytochrome c oxidase subunit 2
LDKYGVALNTADGMGIGTNGWAGGILAVMDPVLSPASPQAEALSHLFVITLVVCGVIFAVVALLVLICVVRFGRKANGGEPRQVAGNQRLEISWTVTSILILIGLFVLTVRAMQVADPAADRAPDLVVIGHQWWWEARYPDGTIAANELHIPVGSNLLIRVESADVIHDLWAPQLGRKMDMIPGHPNFLWLRADAPGAYLGTCAEYCGAEHAWMRINIMAQSPADFEEWRARQKQAAPAPNSALERRGLEVFQAKTCVNCHTIKGVDASISVAPDLTHFAGRTTIATGVLTNSVDNLRLWLTNPQAVKPGCHMPNFQLEPEEIDALTAYLETTG